ncbi:hypothetical protein BH23GEM4_BH23GEM4_19590 [soil metagenome]
MTARRGRRVAPSRREEPEPGEELPDYAALIRPLDDVNRADRWSWELKDDGGLEPAPDADE